MNVVNDNSSKEFLLEEYINLRKEILAAMQEVISNEKLSIASLVTV